MLDVVVSSRWMLCLVKKWQLGSSLKATLYPTSTGSNLGYFRVLAYVQREHVVLRFYVDHRAAGPN